MRILCVGRNAHNISGEKDAYYAWVNPWWACPREEIRILCVGRNAYNIRGKKYAYDAWAKRRWECPH